MEHQPIKHGDFRLPSVPPGNSQVQCQVETHSMWTECERIQYQTWWFCRKVSPFYTQFGYLPCRPVKGIEDFPHLRAYIVGKSLTLRPYLRPATGEQAVIGHQVLSKQLDTAPYFSGACSVLFSGEYSALFHPNCGMFQAVILDHWTKSSPLVGLVFHQLFGVRASFVAMVVWCSTSNIWGELLDDHSSRGNSEIRRYSKLPRHKFEWKMPLPKLAREKENLEELLFFLGGDPFTKQTPWWLEKVDAQNLDFFFRCCDFFLKHLLVVNHRFGEYFFSSSSQLNANLSIASGHSSMQHLRLPEVVPRKTISNLLTLKAVRWGCLREAITVHFLLMKNKLKHLDYCW